MALFHQKKDEEEIAARIKYHIVPGAGPQYVVRGFPNSMKPVEEFLRSDASWASGKIVLIGGAYRPISDFHDTPFGMMPGVYILANELNMLLLGDQVHESVFLKYLVEVFLILLTAFVFLHLSPTVSALVLTGLLMIGFSSVSVWFFTHKGIFLDYWLPIVGIGIHENISSAEEMLEKWLENRKKQQ